MSAERANIDMDPCSDHDPDLYATVEAERQHAAAVERVREYLVTRDGFYGREERARHVPHAPTWWQKRVLRRVVRCSCGWSGHHFDVHREAAAELAVLRSGEEA